MDRRSFVVAGLCASVPAALSLCGCSFSLRDFLNADVRLPDFSSGGAGDSDEEPAGKRLAEGDESPESSKVGVENADGSELEREPVVPEAVSDTQYGFWMDTASCVGCASCVEACRRKSGAPEDAPARRTVRSYTFDNGTAATVSLSCMHCARPACAQVCPAGAVSKRIDGIVAVDKNRCIGCRYCQQACPFGIPRYTAEGMDKCDCCLGGRVRPGANPHCVEACPTKALRYGTLEQLRQREGCPDGTLLAPTGPSFFLS